MGGNGLSQRVEAVRGFTRFYTRRLGVLTDGLFGTPFPLAEARVLYELAHHETTTATVLAGELDLDPGYLSRLLKSLETRGLIGRQPSQTDGRQLAIVLTEAGRQAFATINGRSRQHVAGMLEGLSAADQTRLVSAMQEVEALLGTGQDLRVPYILRPHQVGDMGWIIQRHATLYAEEYGWSEGIEAMVAEVAADFLRTFDAAREYCWIAEREGETVGSVAIVRRSDRMAKLRLLLVDPKARGLGIGKRLVDECVRFARRKGYAGITLWTVDVLTAARHLYEQAGFRLVKEEPHNGFGPDLVGQDWVLDL